MLHFASKAHAQALVVLAGSPTYFPALTRAVQTGKRVFLACSKDDYFRMVAPMPKALKVAITPVFIDAALLQCVHDSRKWRKSAQSSADLAPQVHAAMLKAFPANTELTALDILPLLTASNLAVELRKSNVALRDLAVAHPDLFGVVEHDKSEKLYRIIALQPGVEAPASRSSEQPAAASKSFAHSHGPRQPKDAAARAKSVPAQQPTQSSPATAAAPAPAPAAEAAGPASQASESPAASPAEPAPHTVSGVLSMAHAAGVVSSSKPTKAVLVQLLTAAQLPVKRSWPKQQLEQLVAEHMSAIVSSLANSAE